MIICKMKQVCVSCRMGLMPQKTGGWVVSWADQCARFRKRGLFAVFQESGEFMTSSTSCKIYKGTPPKYTPFRNSS